MLDRAQPMLHLRHTLGDPQLGASFVQDELRTHDLVVLRVRHDGGIADDALERTVTTVRAGWSMVRFVVEGPVLVRDGAHGIAVERGEAFASSEWGSAPARSLTTASETLLFAWRSGGSLGPSLPHDGLLRLSPTARNGLFDLAHAMAAREPASTVRATRAAAAIFSAAGLPLDAAAPLAAAPRSSHDFARALERVLFPMTSQPMAVDLARALGVCERQALRRANDHFRRFHISVSSWRQYVQGMRVGLGSFFMSQRRARTEHVSRLLGFGSPTSFCHAFHDAGLPSPLAVQRQLLAS